MPVRKFSIPSCPADHDVPQLPVVDASFSKYADALRRISLAIHEYKELSFQEHRSSALLADFAGAEGFVVERGIAGDATAFLATYRQGDGPVVSFNAEYDALPQIGHGCGHNLIAISSLGAALATKSWLQEDPSRVGVIKLFGTPAEETGGGKVDIINAGLYRNVGISLMSHPSVYDGCYLPTIAVHGLEVEYYGKRAHATIAPWDGVNALDALIQGFNNINALRQQLKPTMRLHGIILDGGTVGNFIPCGPACTKWLTCREYTKGAFSARARTSAELRELKTNLVKCLEGAGISTRCTYKISERLHYKGHAPSLLPSLIPDLKVNAPLANRYEQYASLLGVNFPSRREQENLEASASTDQGNVSYEIPALQAVYKIDVPSGEANHTAAFTNAAKSLEAHHRTILSSKVLTFVAIDFLREPEFRQEVTLYFTQN